MRAHNYCTAVVVAIASLLVTGCVNRDNNPIIENLVYEKAKMPVQEGATANVVGTFNIEQEDGETESINTVVYDSRGKQVSTNSLALADNLRTDRALGFLVEMSLAKKESYTFQVFITDSHGKQSNRLKGTFEVTDVF